MISIGPEYWNDRKCLSALNRNDFLKKKDCFVTPISPPICLAKNACGLHDNIIIVVSLPW